MRRRWHQMHLARAAMSSLPPARCRILFRKGSDIDENTWPFEAHWQCALINHFHTCSLRCTSASPRDVILDLYLRFSSHRFLACISSPRFRATVLHRFRAFLSPILKRFFFVFADCRGDSPIFCVTYCLWRSSSGVRLISESQ